MKYISLILCTIILIGILVFGGINSNLSTTDNNQYLRIHIMYEM